MSNFLREGRILIVDDFSGFRLTLKSMLYRLRACQIDQASSGVEAIKLCTENTYQVIFCDYNLGGGQDGQQILEELHQRYIIQRGTLFFMVTAETAVAQVIGAIEYRPDDYLTKPFTGEQLEKKLDRLVERKLALDEIYKTINSGEIEKALTVCDKIIKQKPKFKYSCLKIKSELYVELKDLKSALKIYNEVVKEQPLLWAMMGIGKIYFDQGNFHKSKNYFVETRNLFPRQVNVYDWIAKCESMLGEIEKAEHTLLEAVKISPKSLPRQFSLGKVAAKLQHHDIAHRAFTETVHEGSHSCMLRPKHFKCFYDNSQEAAKIFSGMEKTYLLAKADGVYKQMEKKYKEDPLAMATNLSSVARLFADNGQSEKSSMLLSKLSTALQESGNYLKKSETEEISKNLEGLVDESSKGFLESISSQLKEIQHSRPPHLDMTEPEEEPLIETLPPVSFFTTTDQRHMAKKINKQGLELVHQKKFALALDKFRQAINIAPDNASYYLNAAHVIINSSRLSEKPSLLQEAKNHLIKSNVQDDDLLRRKRYESLMEKLSNV